MHPGDYRRIFAFSVIPAALAVILIVIAVRSPRREPAERRSLPAEWGALGGPFRRFLVADAVFQLGNSSMAFVLLRTAAVGFSAAGVTLVYFGYNIVYALLSMPAGDLSDRVGRRPLIVIGYLLYAVAYGLLALVPTRLGVVAAFLVYSLHSALIEGQQKSLVADLVPADRRATAYGAYYTVVGAALLPASIIAGLLWQRVGAYATFGVAAALAIAAAILFVMILPSRNEQRDRHAG